MALLQKFSTFASILQNPDNPFFLCIFFIFFLKLFDFWCCLFLKLIIAGMIVSIESGRWSVGVIPNKFFWLVKISIFLWLLWFSIKGYLCPVDEFWIDLHQRILILSKVKKTVFQVFLFFIDIKVLLEEKK